MSSSTFSQATCTSITDESWNVKTVEFTIDDAENSFEFKAGQYVTVEFTIQGATHCRCYTVSSEPQGCGGVFTITVKHSVGGVVSTWLHRELAVGAKLGVSRATGDFHLSNDVVEPLLFIAGGVGITPLISMARAMRAAGLGRDTQFLQFARTPADLLFRDELLAMSKAHPEITPHFLVSRDADTNSINGRLNASTLDSMVPGWHLRSTYCCGPDSFMSDMRELFLGRGGQPGRYHQESFVLPAEVKAVPLITAERFTVSLALSKLDSVCLKGETLIDAVHAAPGGIKIPNACRSGVCGTCKLRKLSGEVDMQHNGGITEEEVDEGFVLACCSTPLSDVVLEY
ncbi:ferredoxin-NADP reductase [Caballeronia udeis]|uniref:Ferredoxin-NADP reductase n=1 Tax=Caballeronia udeis TaxID=1232866 RepID=A0ABW8MJB5_9BURK